MNIYEYLLENIIIIFRIIDSVIRFFYIHVIYVYTNFTVIGLHIGDFVIK